MYHSIPALAKNHSLTSEEIKIRDLAISLDKALVDFAQALEEHCQPQESSKYSHYLHSNATFPLEETISSARLSASDCLEMSDKLYYGLTWCLPYDEGVRDLPMTKI